MIHIIVQARTTSKRLPGKVLMPVMGRPLIGYTLESLKRTRRQLITAVPQGDESLVKAAREYGLVHEGPEDNVAERYAIWLREHRPDAFVRICGDSPLIDWRIVKWCIDVFEETKPDILGNLNGFPAGQHVEVVNTEFFLENISRADPEHVTKGLYEFSNSRILGAIPPCDDPPMVVDTAEDFLRVKTAIELCDGRPWAYGFREIQEFMK